MINFKACGYRNLQDFSPPSGGGLNWDNRISSLVNNQTTGTVSKFWDFTNGTSYLGDQKAYGYRENLVYDSAASGGTWNDRISRVFVC
ncbi:hypothetical protein GA0074692_0819 [Micromonospora pallida]|uniref:Beta/Gamma crystallin n=1 Tax=Micromonospora pallida TaxID=145854 RepID=A0A1C6RT68_9ACTN|nr:hypothetical protein [Micromonospora pallida]SCL20243.1 hypothetical protein GA0074692_0819 [Micromonospora pallida]